MKRGSLLEERQRSAVSCQLPRTLQTLYTLRTLILYQLTDENWSATREICPLTHQNHAAADENYPLTDEFYAPTGKIHALTDKNHATADNFHPSADKIDELTDDFGELTDDFGE